jgi:hypothetical protein
MGILNNNRAEIERYKLLAMMNQGASPLRTGLANTVYQLFQTIPGRKDRNTFSEAYQDIMGGWQAYQDYVSSGNKDWKEKYGRSSQMSGLGMLSWAQREAQKNADLGLASAPYFKRFFGTGPDAINVNPWQTNLQAAVVGMNPYDLAIQQEEKYGVHDVLGEFKTDIQSGNISVPTPSNTGNVRPSGGNINTGGDDTTTVSTTGSKPTTITSNRPTGGKRNTTTNVTTQTRPTLTTSSYLGDPSGRKAKSDPFRFEDTKANRRGWSPPTTSRTTTSTASRVRPGYGKPPTRPGGR